MLDILKEKKKNKEKVYTSVGILGRFVLKSSKEV